mmetsp:Transcript_15630/g.37268  ORF Transcript_15630/g.37268 Transcript_15630/m.37268 type:complete len:414 (-) Transcript_15630:153-1394(-)
MRIDVGQISGHERLGRGEGNERDSIVILSEAGAVDELRHTAGASRVLSGEVGCEILVDTVVLNERGKAAGRAPRGRRRASRELSGLADDDLVDSAVWPSIGRVDVGPTRMVLGQKCVRFNTRPVSVERLLLLPGKSVGVVLHPGQVEGVEGVSRVARCVRDVNHPAPTVLARRPERHAVHRHSGSHDGGRRARRLRLPAVHPGAKNEVPAENIRSDVSGIIRFVVLTVPRPFPLIEGLGEGTSGVIARVGQQRSKHVDGKVQLVNGSTGPVIAGRIPDHHIVQLVVNGTDNVHVIAPNTKELTRPNSLLSVRDAGNLAVEVRCDVRSAKTLACNIDRDPCSPAFGRATMMAGSTFLRREATVANESLGTVAAILNDIKVAQRELGANSGLCLATSCLSLYMRACHQQQSDQED